MRRRRCDCASAFNAVWIDRARLMRQLRPGLWHWTRDHPQWTTEDDRAGHQWGPEVSSYAFASAHRLVLIDPVVLEGGIEELFAGREPVTVLTCPWHARDARTLGAPVYAPAPESGDTNPVPATIYTAGEILDLGITAFVGLEPIDFVLWVPDHKALVFGDTLVDLGNGLELPDDWGPSDASHPDVMRSLSSLLDLPVELALPNQEAPADRAAFQRAVKLPSD